jgi:hypothetical protein
VRILELFLASVGGLTIAEIVLFAMVMGWSSWRRRRR